MFKNAQAFTFANLVRTFDFAFVVALCKDAGKQHLHMMAARGLGRRVRQYVPLMNVRLRDDIGSMLGLTVCRLRVERWRVHVHMQANVQAAVMDTLAI